ITSTWFLLVRGLRERAPAVARHGPKDQLLNFVPHCRIAVHTRVAFANGILVPRPVGNIDSAVTIVKLEIPEYFCRLWILCPYMSGAVNEDPISLEEVCGRGHI